MNTKTERTLQYKQRRNRHNPFEGRINARISKADADLLQELAGSHRKRSDVVRDILGTYCAGLRKGKKTITIHASIDASE